MLAGGSGADGEDEQVGHGVGLSRGRTRRSGLTIVNGEGVGKSGRGERERPQQGFEGAAGADGAVPDAGGMVFMRGEAFEALEQIGEVVRLVRGAGVDAQDGMEMVGHHDPGVAPGFGMALEQAFPAGRHQPPQLVEFAPATRDHPELALVVRHLRSDEEPAPGVVDVRVAKRIGHGGSYNRSMK